MRQKIVAGNWKMNTLITEGETLANAIIDRIRPDGVSTIICPPFTHLTAIQKIVADTADVYLGGQECSPYDSGAFTGQISAPVLKDIGAEYVIIGHSERRNYQGENDEICREKIKNALAHGLKPIFCCGETRIIRSSGLFIEYILDQIKTALFNLDAEEMKNVVIAYEPIWAIGTGEVATPEQAQDVHAKIRQHWSGHYGNELGDNLPILYGGSCKPSNAKEIFSKEDVDGGLIGGASLKPDDFIAIHEAFD